MSLALLLDENISWSVAEAIARARPDIPCQSVHTFSGGALVAASDADVLSAAREAGLTVVTYDIRILSDLAFWFDTGIPFAGLILVDERTIGNHDFGGLQRALIELWDRQNELDWTGRLVWLSRS